MPTLIVFPNVFKPDERKVVHIGPDQDIASYAAEHYKDYSCELYINGEKVECGVVNDQDVAAVIVKPAAPVAAVVAAYITWQTVATIVISLAISYIVSSLFKPKTPSFQTATGAPAASPVYSITAQQNAARLGAPIPVVYGEVIALPDYAAQPVVEFINNEQYLYALFCVGQGEHEVLDMIIGETSSKSISTSIADYRVFQPADHLQTFGTIETAFGVPENVFTNPEVGDQELVPPGFNPADWFWLAGRSWAVGDPAPVTAPVETDRNWFVNAAKPTIGTVHIYNDGTNEYEMIATSPRVAIGVNDIDPALIASYMIVGSFEMCRSDQQGTNAALDFVFGSGLFKQDSGGNLASLSCAIRIIFTPIDANGNVAGADIIQDHTFTAATNTPQRYTLKYTLPLGRYRCACYRITAAKTIRENDRVTWAGLKLGIVTVIPKVYGNVTLIAAKIKATNGISGNSTGRIRFKVKRKLPINAVGAVATTSNPVNALIDIVTSKYGGNRPYDNNEFNQTELINARTKWAGHNGFNAIFDRPTTVWEAMVLSLQTVAAVPLPMGSQISIAHDTVKQYRMAMFTDNNMVANTISIQYEFAKIGDPSGVRIEYRDPIGFEPAYVSMPPNRDDVVDINLFGCTDINVATQHAQLQLNRLKLQRKSIAFETEMEGLSVRYGDRIAVSHSMPNWGQSAEVLRYIGDVLVLNEKLDWSGSNHILLLRDSTGVPHTVTNISKGSKDNEIIVPSLPFVPNWAEGELEPTLVAFGLNNKVVTDWIVTTMEPKDDYRIAIGAVAYDPAIYNNTMPHQQNDGTSDPTV